MEDSGGCSTESPSVKAVIFNADDFGARAETNAAIRRAHLEGVLTSASLMVVEAAAAEGVEIARELPSLAIGLHLATSNGRAALPPATIPHLVDSGGRFREDPARAGIAYFFRPAARREIAREVEAQFERFAATGLTFSHVDGHQHLHLHPVVWDQVVRQCRTHRVKCIRVPCEEAVSGAPAGRRMERAFLMALRRRCLRSIREHGLYVADRVYGHIATGRMTAAYVSGLLGRLGGQVNEIYLHPGTAHAMPMPGGPAGMDVELDALLSPRVRERIEALNLRLTTYPEVAAEPRESLVSMP